MVSDVGEVVQLQQACRIDQAIGIAQQAVVDIERQGAVAEQLAALLNRAGHAGGQRVVTANAAAVAQLACGEGSGCRRC